MGRDSSLLLVRSPGGVPNQKGMSGSEIPKMGGIRVPGGLVKSGVAGPCTLPCDRRERESHRMHCALDFSFLCLSPFFLCFPLLLFSLLLLSLPFSFVPPPAFSLLCFHSQEDKNQLFHCISRLCGSAGFGAGDALWCHRAGSRHLDLWGDVLPRPDISRRPAHDGIDFSPVLHFSG